MLYTMLLTLHTFLPILGDTANYTAILSEIFSLIFTSLKPKKDSCPSLLNIHFRYTLKGWFHEPTNHADERKKTADARTMTQKYSRPMLFVFPLNCGP